MGDMQKTINLNCTNFFLKIDKTNKILQQYLLQIF